MEDDQQNQNQEAECMMLSLLWCVDEHYHSVEGAAPYLDKPIKFMLLVLLGFHNTLQN